MLKSHGSQETRAGNAYLPLTMIHCAVPENIHTPPTQQGLEFSGDGEFCKTSKI